MLKYVIKAQEDERKRISRELHDSVAQESLSSLVDLRVVKYMDVGEDVLKKSHQTEVSLTRLLDDIRHLSVELRPASLILNGRGACTIMRSERLPSANRS